MDFFNVLLLLTTGTTPGGGTTPGTGTGGSISFDFAKTLMKGIAGTVKGIGSGIVVILGILLIIAGVIQLAKALASSGRAANWVAIVGCIVLGGIFAIGGFKMVTGVYMMGAGKETVDVLLKGIEPNNGATIEKGSANSTDPTKSSAYAMSSLIDGFILPFGQMLCVCVGALLITICCVKVGKYFMAGGRGQVEWLRVLAMCLIGGAMFAGVNAGNNLDSPPWDWIKKTAVGAFKDTVNAVADGGSNSASSYANTINATALDQWAQQQGSGGGGTNSTNTTNTTTPYSLLA